MLSMNQINVNFSKAKAEAQAIENIATSVDTLAKKKMENVIDKLRKSWKGENANLFIAKEVKLQNQIIQYAKELREIAKDIRKTAQTIYETEKRNYEIAAKRVTTGVSKGATIVQKTVESVTGEQNSSLNDGQESSNPDVISMNYGLEIGKKLMSQPDMILKGLLKQ